MNSPAIKTLTQSGAKVDILTLESNREVVEANPLFSRRFYCKNNLFSKLLWALIFRLCEDYQLAVQFNTSLLTNFLMWITGATERLGYNYKARFIEKGMFNSIRVPIAHRTYCGGNRIEEVNELLYLGLGLEPVTDEMIFRWDGSFPLNVSPKNLIIFHLNTKHTQEKRRWHGWNELLKRFHRANYFNIVFTGTESDRTYVRHELNREVCITTIQELAGLLNFAVLCVSVNTFTMHLAVAVKCPLVAIVGGTPARVVLRENPRTEYVEGPDLDMNKITVEEVWNKCRKFLPSTTMKD